MKKLFFAALTAVMFSIAITGCGKNENDSPSDTKPTDYYSIGTGYAGTEIDKVATLRSEIKTLYETQMSKICKIQSGLFVTDKSEKEVASSCSEVEVEAQKACDKYDWEGDIIITINHYVNDSEKVIYEKYFSKTEISKHILSQTIEVVDSLCAGLSTSELGTLRQVFNKKFTNTVIGKSNVSERFLDVSDSILANAKTRMASYESNQVIVLFYSQFDSFDESTLKTYLVASKDSTCDAYNAATVKDALSVTYRFECETGNHSYDMWSEFYRTEIIKFMESCGGAMQYRLTNYCPDPIKSDSIMKDKMISLETAAAKWHKDAQCTKQCSITVLHYECFFDKRNNDTIYHHIFPAEQPQ